MFTTFDKALAAFLASVVSLLAVFNIDVPFLADPAVQGVIVTVAVTVFTYLVPNKKSA